MEKMYTFSLHLRGTSLLTKTGLCWLTTVKCLHAAVHSASGLEESHIFTAEMQKQIMQAGRRLMERHGRALSCRAAAVRRWLPLKQEGGKTHKEAWAWMIPCIM